MDSFQLLSTNFCKPRHILFSSFLFAVLAHLPKIMFRIGILNMTGGVIAADATILFHPVIKIWCWAPLCQTGVKSDEQLLNTVCHYKTVNTGLISSPLENVHARRV